MSGAGALIPDLVPARMLNEFVYCPRLFWLEWVQGLWADNPDTALGELVHGRSDRGGGRLPEPEGADYLWSGEARSITLDAPQLGLIAKMDVVEGEDGTLSPVDHKKGRPRSDGTPWEPERLQMAAQILVLRENGYPCERGYISFRETRSRVAVEYDEALESEVRRRLDELRAVAARAEAPPPLVDSPKCPRCSLVEICLPDETNALRLKAERTRLKRRLLAARPDAKPLYVQEPGAVVRLSQGRIEVRKERDVLASLRQIDLSEVALFGGATISEPALRQLASAGIPITHFSFGGRLEAITVGFDPNNIDLRIAQFREADDREASLRLSRTFVSAKIRNARVLLRRNGGQRVASAVRELQRLARLARLAPDLQPLLGIEGAAAREYYRALAQLITPRAREDGLNLAFERRSRRPPRDPANAVLSLLYALLTKECVVALRRVGFDPLLGFFHRPRFGRPALALDLMEEFRPLIADSVFLTLVNGGRLTRGDFIARAGAVGLTRSGRRAVIGAFEQRMGTEVIHPIFGYRAVYRRVLELQARLLAAFLLRDVPEYRPFVTR
ncbi:MAG TPA: CRISPR-associated endonuclease Cas1 [Gaiellaceae bacterium]|nr:CRISPR-associated endonuclease Cas1 [Gaiellaceae bacterium]